MTVVAHDRDPQRLALGEGHDGEQHLQAPAEPRTHAAEDPVRGVAPQRGGGGAVMEVIGANPLGPPFKVLLDGIGAVLAFMYKYIPNYGAVSAKVGSAGSRPKRTTGRMSS